LTAKYEERQCSEYGKLGMMGISQLLIIFTLVPADFSLQLGSIALVTVA